VAGASNTVLDLHQHLHQDSKPVEACRGARAGGVRRPGHLVQSGTHQCLTDLSQTNPESLTESLATVSPACRVVLR
jgi:hypothetical protein